MSKEIDFPQFKSSCSKMFLQTSRVFQVETTWKGPFPRSFNVE